MSFKNIKYHLLEPIIAQEFITQVLALFYTAMCHQSYFKNISNLFFEQPDKMNKIISNFNSSVYLQLIDDVCLAAFTLDA